MAAGQSPLTAPPEQVTVTTPPNAPVEQVPSDQATAMLAPEQVNATVPQGIPSDVLAGLQAAQPPGQVMTATPVLPATPSTEEHVTRHMGWLHNVLDRVGTILGGDQTLHITKDTDGNVTITHDPSTTGEKWGRVAAAALGGAAQGLANSQGPGGLARAAAAGTQYGLQLPQQRQQQVQQEATAEQKLANARASNAMIHQNMVKQMLDNKLIGLKLSGAESDLLNDYRDDLLSDPSAKDYGVINSADDMHQIGLNDAQFLKQHANLQLKAAALPDGKGGWSLHAIATDPGDDARLVGPEDKVYGIDIDPDTSKPILTAKPAAKGQKKGTLRLANQATILQYMTGINNWTKANKEAMASHLTGTPGATAALIVQKQQDLLGETNPAKITQLQTEIASLKGLHQQQLSDVIASRPVAYTPMQTTGGEVGFINPRNPAAAPIVNPEVSGRLTQGSARPWPAEAEGLHGEDFIEQIPADMREQVRNIARGDTKMPTAARGANQAIRNAVFNYDPTYTDARYTTKQNFKTGRDSDDLKRLSTALSHAENALQNSAAVGFSVSPTHMPTAASARFRTDADFLTDEIGTLVKGGSLTQGQANKRIEDLHSSFPTVRQAAINESLKLLGGRVGAILDKYRRGAGQDLPLDEFFGQDERDRILRHKVLPQASQPGATTGPANQPPPATGQFTVTDPNGKVHPFNSQAEADNFKRLAGIP